MISRPLTEEENHLIPLMNGHRLRKAVSAAAAAVEMDKLGKEVAEEAMAAGRGEVQQAECECCGMKEDCTADYIAAIKTSFSGKWVCGLCSEAVKERLRRAPRTAMEGALRFHRTVCQEFNTTTRANPKLSLTCAMRKIARRSFESRHSKECSSNSKLGRTTSCHPRIDL